MIFKYLKTISRSLSKGLKFIFIDETGFVLENTNMKIFRRADDEILEGSKNNIKKKLI